MANKKFLKTYESYKKGLRKEKKNKSSDKVNETVNQVDDIYKVGSINIPQSLINSYVKKVKDETQKNLRQLYSDMEIAEELVKYAVDTHLNSDELPVSALLGGAHDEEIGNDLNDETPEEEISTGIEDIKDGETIDDVIDEDTKIDNEDEASEAEEEISDELAEEGDETTERDEELFEEPIEKTGEESDEEENELPI